MTYFDHLTGEEALQLACGSADRAARFHRDQMLDHLNPAMVDFVRACTLFFLGTADETGACDCTMRSVPAGCLVVLDHRHLAWPELRGNGVLASLGNISRNPNAALMMPHWGKRIGLHVNGRATFHTDDVARAAYGALLPRRGEAGLPDRVIEHWVVVAVVEAYIHCGKHFPRAGSQAVPWGTDDTRAKGGDFFGVAAARRAERPLPLSA